MTAVAFRGVRLELGGRTVLDGMDVAVDDHEFVGVLGPNGAGKTTFLRAILGLVPAAAGAIEVLGRAASRGDPRVGYMPQLRAAPPAAKLSGRDFVACALDGHLLGLPIPTRAGRREVDRVLDLARARDLAGRPLAELSGGERQRLLLAQALLGRPRLLLLDEPLTSLDPRRQGEAVDLVRSLQRALGIAVLFSAHDVNPLLGAIDRVLYLGGGHAAIGAADEVITGPVLSRLYGTNVEVLRVAGRIFVTSAQGARPAAREAADAGL